jgi:hypothetical protein
MSVKNQHKDYTNMTDKWERCRAASKGQEAVHAAGSKFLPMLADQSSHEYEAYKLRTSFYNATWRTISGLQGMLFRKPAMVEVPAVAGAMLEDVSLGGESLHMFSLEVVEECLTVGRVGVFVDYPAVDVEVTTAADAKSMNLRPIFKRYQAESIINWKTSVINNASVLSMVVLTEEINNNSGDEFSNEVTIQYRVLDLAPVAVGDTVVIIYRVRVFKIDKSQNKEVDVLISTAFPMIDGKQLTYLPFYFIGVDSVDPSVDEPPLIDLVDVNLSHYRTNADYEHGCHFTGLPTPVITGFTPDKADATFNIGSTTAWVFPRPDAKAFYLEFTGQGLSMLENNLQRKETQMAVLGARMLENKQNNGDSQGGAAINMGGEQSMLASIAQAVSIGLQRALATFVSFTGAQGTVRYLLNKDFFPMPMTPLALTALVASWQNGAISYETLFNNLKQGEVIDIDQTIAKELVAMEQHKAEIPGGTQVNQSAKPTHEVANPTQRQLQTP